MLSLHQGRYLARLDATPGDIDRAQWLRWLAFVAARSKARGGADADGSDSDEFDPRCRHVLVEEARSGTLVATFRLLPMADGGGIGQSYSAQYYDLGKLAGYDSRMLEVGRFCVHPQWRDPDIVRLAWAALTRYVDTHEVRMVFGCSSFLGTEAAAYLDAFAMLKARHLAPPRWRPAIKAPDVFDFAHAPRWNEPDQSRALRVMPPLLRTYLRMGGWVSDHAVIDRVLGTLHVFTGLEIQSVPEGRARVLRATAP